MITFPHNHVFGQSDKEDYEYCEECGTYHSLDVVPVETVYQNDYWSREHHRSTLIEQQYNLTERESCGISKVEKVLQYVPERGTTLEIGCAPGTLLQLLTLLEHEVYGIEPDINVINYLKKHCGSAIIIEGYFPEVFSKTSHSVFDCIIATDVLEHVPDYEIFFRYRIYRMLS